MRSKPCSTVQHDQERLDRLAEVRNDKAVWGHRCTYEQSKRQYLGEDVLKDTGSAAVRWLAKNDEHVERMVADLGLLARRTSAANDTEVPERQHGPPVVLTRESHGVEQAGQMVRGGALLFCGGRGLRLAVRAGRLLGAAP
ncbi:hypothetical protein [Streptomyces avidinii]|uniref:hypothetical protein n=1 Tax=Streptomyces avidinii TaxID=1895 RepID=UPI001E49EA69|nr:hypothetical protein [Streptomyces avidinii]